MLLFTLIVVLLIIVMLVRDRMRPGLVLLSGAIILMCGGVLTPRETLEGFSNKGMITVALLFLVSEGVRRSGLLEKMLMALLPSARVTLTRVHLRLLPIISFVSAFLNNTPVVVIFAPMIKRWGEKVGIAPTRLLIPLSYATILGGVCTLIGTSTNLVVHGMVIEAGYDGFTLFEFAPVGLCIATVGILYIIVASHYLLPESRGAESSEAAPVENAEGLKRTQVVLAARFPAIGRRIIDFDFYGKYGAHLIELRREGQSYSLPALRRIRFREGDTLTLMADDQFMKNWGDSSFFLLVDMEGGVQKKEREMPTWKKWFSVVLVALMILGAAIGELPGVAQMLPEGAPKLDMFFFVCVVVILMAWMNIFPARKYTKFVSWDILITIASAFAISKAMQNSGMADAVAAFALSLASADGPLGGLGLSPQATCLVMLGVIFVITNLFTELMTNNAAAALAFPLALSLVDQLGASPMPFFVCICMAASASFSTPIGYQTNLIVQGVGGYRFSDFVRIGLPLNLLALVLSVWLIPLFWPF